MIRNIHHSTHHSLTAARPAAKTQAETNPFRNVLDSTSTETAATTKAASSPATITATITKPAAKPVVTLSPPVYEQSPTVANPDGSESPLNWTQFASAATADQIAAKLGGTVDSVISGGNSTAQRSIRVQGSPNLVNAGIAAQLFAQYGDKPGSQAWQIINRDLGRDPMST
jgi:hypothetical protein